MNIKEKKVKKLNIISIVLILFFLFTFNSALAVQDIDNKNTKANDAGSQQKYRIVIKLNDKTAAQAEASLSQKSMEIEKSTKGNMAEFFTKYGIKRMEPVYKDLVNLKKRTGKKENDFRAEIKKKFPKRMNRSQVNEKAAPAGLLNTYVIEADVNNDKDYENLIESLKKDDRVVYAEPDLVVSTNMIPDDPYFSSKGTWGQSYDDLYGVKITSCPEAWDTTKGSGVTVAVVDSGIDNTHPDIVSNLWTNTKEIANNGIDDDGNGYIDDTWGWDFVNSDNKPADDNGHGTHVAGIIAAAGNNGTGIIGVAPESKVMAVKAFPNFGSGYVSNIAAAILYATGNGADVINLSLGAKGYSQQLKDAVDEAISMGVVVVVAAGNDNADAMDYTPANLNNVITVAATDAQDYKASFSNWGSCIDVAAPGVDILSLYATGTLKGTRVGDKYTRLNGTSMAAPHVSGAVSLILAQHPDFSNDQVKTALLNSTVDVMSRGFDDETGYGRINTANALSPLLDVEGISLNKDTINMTVGNKEQLNATIEPIGAYRYVTWSVSEESIPDVVAVDQNGIVTANHPGKAVIRATSQIDTSKFAECTVTVTSELARTLLSEGFENHGNFPLDWTVENVNGTYGEWSCDLAGVHPTPKSGGYTADYNSINISKGESARMYKTEGISLGSDGIYYLDFWMYHDTRNTASNDYIQVQVYTDKEPVWTNVGSNIPRVDGSTGWKRHTISLDDYKNISNLKIAFLGVSQCGNNIYLDDISVNNIVPVTDISLNKTSVELEIGQTEQLTATLLPETATNKNVTWYAYSQKNTYSVASVSSEGLVTADNPGTAVIRVISDADPNKYAECTVTVPENKTKTSFSEGFESNGSIPTGWAVQDVNGTYGEWNFVDYGLWYVYPKTGGWMAEFNSGAIPSGQSTRIYRTEGISLGNDSTCSLDFWMYHDTNYATSNDYIQVQVSTDRGSSWTSLGSEIYRYDGSIGWKKHIISLDNYKGVSDLRIAFLGVSKEGHQIYLDDITANNAASDIPVTEVKLNKTSSELTVGQTEQLTATVMPENATNKNVTWSVYNNPKNAVSVSQKGLVTAERPGSAVIRATSDENPGKYDECTVTVKSVPITEVKLNKTSVELTVGQTEQLTVTVMPENATNKNIIWSGNANDVAIVSANGLVTANSPGTAVIRATSKDDSSKYTECTVTVTEVGSVTGISLNKSFTSLTVGQTEQLAATLMPENATNKNVTWTVYEDANNAVSVSETGLITANNPGTAVIRVTSQADPSKYDECTVIVEPENETLINEGFENNGSIPEGWTVQNVNGTDGKWGFVSYGMTSGEPKAGKWMAEFNSFYTSYGQSTRLFTTTGLRISNYGKYHLDFWMYHDAEYTDRKDCIQVQVSTDQGISWTNLGSEIYRFDGSIGWKKHTISLGDYKGVSDLRIAFLGVAEYGNNMYLDDISINSISSSDVPVTEVSLNKAFAELTIGQSEQLTALVMPDNATNKNVTWSVQAANNAVSISEAGLIRANNPGTAVVRVTSTADPSRYAQCTVTVTAPEPVNRTLLNEGFENNGSIPVGWAVLNGTIGKWNFVSIGSLGYQGIQKSGEWLARFNSYSTPGGQNARLYMTSGLSLGNDGTYFLDFWMYHNNRSASNNDYIQVQVSTNNGSNWTNLGSSVYRNDGSIGWKKHTINLDQYKGVSDLRIAFVGISSFGDNIFLDDIAVTSTSN